MLLRSLCCIVTLSLTIPAARAVDKPPPTDLDSQLLRELGGDDLVPKPKSNNPIAKIADEMHIVVGELSDLSTGEPTQEKQQQIVKKLDEIIAQLEKECEACKKAGKSGNNPNKPLADSVIVGGPGGIGDLHAPRPGGKQWGDLPPHQRDRILQSLENGFPAHYQRILERYYRRLAEEQPVGATGEKDSAPPAGASEPKP